ncbi:MAG: L,D-transpeptidase family protein [Alphaproteobacteria bacterium]|nr:L,D-transpeptidase family protein [Alphaproteobacteria bacterium]MBV9372454.1 L,D-transpeptidase family protein [Alphaproteobacteria bacterium]MBV9902129.1 L,D-transpeptidase family protein [Alphaproteobacteria bacterium]
MLRLLLVALFGLALGSAVPPSADRPAAPQLGYADLGCDGCADQVLPGRPPAATPLPPPPPPSRVKVLVSLSQQKAWVFRDGLLLATSPVSTGKSGHETPLGRFRILQKKVHHRSNRYSNAPMPYMQRLTNYGIALHAGHLPGYPASHGCIRLPPAFARRLYALTDFGTRVTVTRARPKSAGEALKLT